MGEIKDGGPAFPVFDNPGDGQLYSRDAGMHLRDWFAGQALVGFLSGGMSAVATVAGQNATGPAEIAAEAAYQMAAAMLRAREGGSNAE